MTIVIGYIPNAYGEAALAAGIEEAKRRNTGVLVVNASKGDTMIDSKYVGESDWANFQNRLDELDVPHDVRQTIGPDVADELLDAAREVDAEAIVIGIRHRSAVGKMLMGSVAQRVLLDAPCPVIAVKPA
jgi:nucleotide-binding universal stress UspA family protein